ncbi:hypothetical protein C8Q73DRAFT_475474 [Cubamyces lactineus]|nr:hypothetical protein C8Q73DRAFT_475474 [Cubamyces lactineus]
MDPSHILKLPADVQVRIMSFLDAPGILACRQASRQLAKLVDDTVALQYQLELALAGMVDAPPGSASVRARLDALRAYRDAQARGEHPLFEIVDHGDHLRFVRSAETEIVYLDRSQADLPLTVYRPRSEYCGLEELRETFGGVKPLLDAHPDLDMSNVYVDYQQDLVVYSYFTIHTAQNISMAHCHVASLSQTFNQHPLAAREELSRDHAVPMEGSVRIGLQVVDDLVLWTTTSFAIVSVIVYNWKTGVIVWRMDEDSGVSRSSHLVHVGLLSSTALVLVDHAEFALCLYRLDPTATSDSPVISVDDYACMLRLPERTSPHPSCSIERYGAPAPPSKPGSAIPAPAAAASFLPDLSLPVLVLRFMWLALQSWFGESPEDNVGAVGERDELCRLFVPHATLLRFLPDRRPGAATSGFVASFSDGVRSGFKGDLGDRADSDTYGRVVPWEEWGPRGTRMVRMKARSRSLAGLGANVAIYEETTAVTDEHRFDVYEVHPLAATTIPPLRDSTRAPPNLTSVSAGATPLADAAPPTGASSAADGELDSDSDPESCITNSPAWKAPIRTTYPFRRTKRYVPSTTEDGGQFCDTRMVAGGLVARRRYR